MKLNIKKAPAVIKPNAKLKAASSIMMPEYDEPQFAVKTSFDLVIEENKSVTDFVEHEIMGGVCGAANLVSDEGSTRCGFEVSPLRKFNDDPVNVALYDSEMNLFAEILNAHIHGKPKFVKTAGEDPARLYLTLVGNVVTSNVEMIATFIEADMFVSIDAAQIDMFSSEADKVEEKIVRAEQPLKVVAKAQIAFDQALAAGEFSDANAVMDAAHEYAQRRINEGHSKKKVLLEDVNSAIDFVRSPSAEPDVFSDEFI